MKIHTCSECWLPREQKSTLCRKCKQVQRDTLYKEALCSLSEMKPIEIELLKEKLKSDQLASLMILAINQNHPVSSFVKERSHWIWPHLIQEIRFHTQPHSATCAAVRYLFQQNLFHEIVIAEECCECMYTMVTKGYSEYSSLAIGHLFYNQKEKILPLFQRHLKQKGSKESLLNYINFMLWISNSYEYMTPVASKRVIDILTEAVEIHHPSNKQWILEDLVARPENYQFFLTSPPTLPGNYTETMFDFFPDFEVWWNFWERVQTSVRKKIEFRSSLVKDELMMQTWKPERVRKWCLDTEDLIHIERYFAR